MICKSHDTGEKIDVDNEEIVQRWQSKQLSIMLQADYFKMIYLVSKLQLICFKA